MGPLLGTLFGTWQGFLLGRWRHPASLTKYLTLDQDCREAQGDLCSRESLKRRIASTRLLTWWEVRGVDRRWQVLLLSFVTCFPPRLFQPVDFYPLSSRRFQKLDKLTSSAVTNSPTGWPVILPNKMIVPNKVFGRNANNSLKQNHKPPGQPLLRTEHLLPPPFKSLCCFLPQTLLLKRRSSPWWAKYWGTRRFYPEMM